MQEGKAGDGVVEQVMEVGDELTSKWTESELSASEERAHMAFLKEAASVYTSEGNMKRRENAKEKELFCFYK